MSTGSQERLLRVFSVGIKSLGQSWAVSRLECSFCLAEK